MNCCQELPEGYQEIFCIDLQRDKKTALAVNLLCVVLTLAVGIPMYLYCPFWILLDTSDGLAAFFIRAAVLIVGMIAYVVLHELTHAAVMKYYGATKLRFGMSLMYAYAGSEGDYFAKRPYLHTAAAPLLLWGLVFLLLSLLVRGPYLCVILILQLVNISGAAGDLYVMWKVSRLPDDILVRDTGIDMTVFSRETR